MIHLNTYVEVKYAVLSNDNSNVLRTVITHSHHNVSCVSLQDM